MPLGAGAGRAPPSRRERRGQALGIYFGVTGLAVAGGPVVGGAITEGLAWQWIFWINVPIGLRADPARAGAGSPRRAGRTARSTSPGWRSSRAAAFGVVWGLVRGNAAGWGSAEVVGRARRGRRSARRRSSRWERRVADPMLPMRFFRSRAFAAGNAADLLRRRGAVRRGVLPRPVPADRARLRAARRRACGCCRGRRRCSSSRRVAGALVDRFGERPFMVGGLLLQADRDGLDRADRRARHGLRRDDRAADHRGLRRLDGVPGRRRTRSSARCRRRRRQGGGHQRTLRELGGVFGIALLVAVFAGSGRLRVAGRVRGRLRARAGGHRRRSRSWARWSGSRYPASSMSCVHATSCQVSNLKPTRR